MFIFAVRFNCKKWGSLYMSFWVHKVLDFNVLKNNVPRATSFFRVGNNGFCIN